MIDGNELSLEQIYQRMGISRKRVRQIEKQALQLLYGQLAKKSSILVKNKVFKKIIYFIWN
ncbi:sigma factor-like helix-turn-helix DNA-binding protein [Nostoc sp.]|uniref:sigma factor-like helix-turn-helix DNA-binding protein n=1 Tax=Nostoc sp. TaxID=1180 RepID=UPI002FFA240C